MSKNAFFLSKKHLRIAFVGSAGIPNRHGGFESFLEHCAPEISKKTRITIVTCDSKLYEDKTSDFNGVHRIFIPIRANGILSIVHDLIAFLRVLPITNYIVILGVSGGIWFPLFRILCTITGRRLLVNIDGVEWRRLKFNRWQRGVLKFFDALAQCCSHQIVYDNPALAAFVIEKHRKKASHIAYPGDYVCRLPELRCKVGTALTICRIEPENNINMLIEGALDSRLGHYTIVGNWQHSDYGRELLERHGENPRLTLLGPVYEPKALASLRESCEIYIHGHSVGGTNPSLVEMLFYECHLFCFDCLFNRYTAETSAMYFTTADDLSNQLDSLPREASNRSTLRARYTREVIAEEYVALFRKMA